MVDKWSPGCKCCQCKGDCFKQEEINLGVAGQVFVEGDEDIPETWQNWLYTVGSDVDQVKFDIPSSARICAPKVKMKHWIAQERYDEAFTITFELDFNIAPDDSVECSPATIEFHAGDNVSTWDIGSAYYAGEMTVDQSPGQKRRLGPRPDQDEEFTRQFNSTGCSIFDRPDQPRGKVFEGWDTRVQCLVAVTPEHIRAEITGYVFEGIGTKWTPDIHGFKCAMTESTLPPLPVEAGGCKGHWWFEVNNGGVRVKNFTYYPATVTVREPDPDIPYDEGEVEKTCNLLTSMRENWNYETRKLMGSKAPFSGGADPLCPCETFTGTCQKKDPTGYQWTGPGVGDYMCDFPLEGFASNDIFSVEYDWTQSVSNLAYSSKECYGPWKTDAETGQNCLIDPTWWFSTLILNADAGNQGRVADVVQGTADEFYRFENGGPTVEVPYPRLMQVVQARVKQYPTDNEKICDPDGPSNCCAELERYYIDANEGVTLVVNCSTTYYQGSQDSCGDPFVPPRDSTTYFKVG